MRRSLQQSAGNAADALADGERPKGVETSADVEERKRLLRALGYRL
jgi:adenosine/AMP kinase